MDPLTVFVVSIVGSLVADALRSKKEIAEFYPKSGEGTLEHYYGWVAMDGRNVRWWVERGEAVWIEAKYLRPLWGNIFDADKLGAVAGAVRKRRQQGKEPIEFYASYGQISRVTAESVAESLAYEDCPGDPFTTGDRQLDAWLVSRYLDEPSEDPETDEEMQERLAEAKRTGAGDLGKWTATVRDGNHRVFGSVLGGEEKIAIRVYDNDVQEIREQVRRETDEGASLREPMRPAQRDLLRKMVADGGLPHWLDQETAAKVLGSEAGRHRRS